MRANRLQLIIGLLLIPQLLFVRIVSNFPDKVETYYSNGIYPLISKLFRFIFGWLPFSFGDIMYAIMLILILRSIYQLIRNKLRNWKPFLLRSFAIISIVYFAFHFLWGMNYYRLPIDESLGLEKEYTSVELLSLTEKLILKSNALHSALADNDSMPVITLTRNENGDFSAFAKADLFNSTLQGYEAITKQFPELSYPPKSIKTSLLSYPLSIMGYSGYLNPITNESQVNGYIPHHRWPVVSCHEQAHQLGYAKENEANFFAVLATLANEDPYFQYSGSIFALRYCLNDLYRRDEKKASELRALIHPGILKNYQESRDFWASMENPLEPIFKNVYSGYLKANNQPKGLKTYSYVVALLVNYDKRFPNIISALKLP